MPNFTEDQLRVVFDLFDCDGCGFIMINEMPLALKALGLNLSQVAVDKAVTDATEEGVTRITFDHFKQIALPQSIGRNSEEEIQFTFKLLDRKNRGAIDIEDLIAATSDMADLGPAGEKPHRKLFAEFIRESNSAFPVPQSVDENGNPVSNSLAGTVDEQQFAAAVRLAVHYKPRVK